MDITATIGADEQIVALYPFGNIKVLTIREIADTIADLPGDADMIPTTVYVKTDRDVTLAVATLTATHNDRSVAVSIARHGSVIAQAVARW